MFQLNRAVSKYSKWIDFSLKWINIIYYKSILMVSLLIIMLILVFVDFSIINCVLLLIFLLIILIYFFKNISTENENFYLNFHKFHYFWNFFLLSISLVLLTRYLYQFTALKFIYEKVKEQTSFKFIRENSQLIGLVIFETDCLDKPIFLCSPDTSLVRNGLLPDIFLFFFSLIAKTYLRLVFISEKNQKSKALINSEFSKKIKSSGENIEKLDVKRGKKNSKSFDLSSNKSIILNLDNISPIRLTKSYLRKEDFKDLDEIFNHYINYPLYATKYKNINFIYKIIFFFKQMGGEVLQSNGETCFSFEFLFYFGVVNFF